MCYLLWIRNYYQSLNINRYIKRKKIMNIQEDYVSFEVAKLLKEKGLDEKCQKVYMHNGQLLWAQIFMEGESFVDNKCIELVANYNNWITYTQGEYAYLCPTIQMAMKWLREVHNINIEIFVIKNFDKKICEYTYTIMDLNFPGSDDGIDCCNKYKTYEEACEAAIKYCLENLI